jgi:hypothetical protein
VLDLFGGFDRHRASNIGTGLDESNLQTAYGGGVDLGIGPFFIGMQYLRNHCQIESASPTTLEFASYGARAGVSRR